MPAERLGTAVVPIREFDVIARDSAGHSGFVGHLALAAAGLPSHRPSDLVPVIHMRPPLENLGLCVADCVGSVGFTAEQKFQVRLFAEELDSEYRAMQLRSPLDQYVICPHASVFSSSDDTVVFRRFSCAGFVIEAYREAGVELLRTDLALLPLVTLDELKSQYPDLARHLDKEKERQKLGIGGDGPWPVLLAGYVLNSLARTSAEIHATPYLSRPGDGFFPPTPPE
jgi:hypothetical protein